MKKILVFTALVLSLFGCGESLKQKETNIKTIDIKNGAKLNVVYVLVGKDIDYNKMSIDEITMQIEKDSLVQINSITPEIYIKPQIIKVYKVEDITCPYLKKRFKEYNSGELVYEYNDKILIKLKDGVIKIYHNHVK